MVASDIQFSPLFPWWLIAALGLIGFCLLAFAAWRRAPAVALRTLAFLAGLLILANPALISEERKALSDIAIVVVDRSPSQDVGARQAHLRTALAALQDQLAGEENLEIRIVEVDSEASGRRRADGTRLWEALSQSLSDVSNERLSAIVFLSDGQVHDLPDLERLRAQAVAASADTRAAASTDAGAGAETGTNAESHGANRAAGLPAAPIHALLTGSQEERDRRIVAVKTPKFGIVGEDVIYTIRIEDQGYAGAAAAVLLRLRKDGEQAQIFQTETGRDLEIPVRIDHGGTNVLEFEVDAAADEVTLLNNRLVVATNGVRDRLRVLLISGEPHSGERTWRNLLKSDPSVDLVHFTILRPPEKQDGTPIRELSLIAFPTRELFQEKLHDFDLIIFDRYRRRGVLPDYYLSNVVDYVHQGGAVLVAAGPTFATPLSLYRTPLADVLPAAPSGAVMAQGFRPALSAIGHRHPVTAELPGAGRPGGSSEPNRPGAAGQAETASWGRWFRLIEAEPQSGEILMTGPENRPLLVMNRIGEGRVAQLLSDHAWLWSKGYEGGGPQAELLRRIAHWLMREPDLEEEVLKARTHNDEILIERRSLDDIEETLTVTRPDGSADEAALSIVAPGKATARIRARQPGLFKLQNDNLTTLAAVGDINPREFADLRATKAHIAPIVEASGGGAFWVTDGLPGLRFVKPNRSTAGTDWIGFRRNGAYIVTGLERLPLFPALIALLALLGLIAMTWYREGH